MFIKALHLFYHTFYQNYAVHTVPLESPRLNANKASLTVGVMLRSVVTDMISVREVNILSWKIKTTKNNKIKKSSQEIQPCSNETNTLVQRHLKRMLGIIGLILTTFKCSS